MKACHPKHASPTHRAGLNDFKWRDIFEMVVEPVQIKFLHLFPNPKRVLALWEEQT